MQIEIKVDGNNCSEDWLDGSVLTRKHKVRLTFPDGYSVIRQVYIVRSYQEERAHNDSWTSCQAHAWVDLPVHGIQIPCMLAKLKDVKIERVSE